MRLDEFDFPFDPRLIADRPVEPRDRARMLVVPRGGGPRAHRHVTDLPDLLDPGDLVVVNDTKVVPAALTGRKRPHGGRVALLLLRPAGDGAWEAMVKGRVRSGQVIDLGNDACLTVSRAASPAGLVTVEGSRPIPDLIKEYGQVPLPPYIKREAAPEDREWYQTIFAREEGAVAAPTAGLHFSQAVLDGLVTRGVRTTTVTLHVGPATFRPVTAERIEDHVMGAEGLIVPEEAAAAVNRARTERRRVVAVGTTVVRALESAVGETGEVRSCRSDTSLFITPGYRFRCVDALLTNFHLPRTTLLMLVSAFVGVEPLREAYREAIASRYRFYSYGDAMLIL